jgi:hypothetical protein
VAESSELQNMDLYHWLVSKYGERQAQVIFDDLLPFDDPDAIPLNPVEGPYAASLSGQVRIPARTATVKEAPVQAFAQMSSLGPRSSIGGGELEVALGPPVPLPPPMGRIFVMSEAALTPTATPGKEPDRWSWDAAPLMAGCRMLVWTTKSMSSPRS